MSERLRRLLAALLELDPRSISAETSAENTPSWDSMRELMLAATLEGEYGIALEIDEMERLRSVASILEVLRSHGVEAP